MLRRPRVLPGGGLMLAAWAHVSKDLIPDVPDDGPVGHASTTSPTPTRRRAAMMTSMATMSPYPVQQVQQMLPGQARVDRADDTGFGEPGRPHGRPAPHRHPRRAHAVPGHGPRGHPARWPRARSSRVRSLGVRGQPRQPPPARPRPPRPLTVAAFPSTFQPRGPGSGLDAWNFSDGGFGSADLELGVEAAGGRQLDVDALGDGGEGPAGLAVGVVRPRSGGRRRRPRAAPARSGTWPSSGTSSRSASSWPAAGAEDLVALAVVAGEPRHVLDDALDLEVDLLGHERGPLGDPLRGRLRRGDHVHLGPGQELGQRDARCRRCPAGRSTRR